MKPLIRHWALSVAILIICASIVCFGDVGRSTLQYQSIGEQGGGVSYRWFTGHFTHIGWRHLILNLLGFISIWAIYGRSLRWRSWLIFLLICPLGVSLGLHLLSPDVGYYLGLSGVLHGLLALASMDSLRRLDHQSSGHRRLKWEDVILFVALWAKVIYEQIYGAIPLTAAISGDQVLVNSHLYGAVIGLAYALLLWVYDLVNHKFSGHFNTPHLDHD